MNHAEQSVAADSKWREALARAFAGVCDLYLQAIYHVEVRGIENYTSSPSTLVVSNHRRDADGPIICEVLLKRRGMNARGPFPILVAREDLFRRGFLSGYLETWPRMLRLAILPVDLGNLLRFLHAYPLRRIPERTLGEVLESLLRIFGNLPLEAVLKRSWIEKWGWFSASSGEELRISHVLSSPHYREQLRKPYGLTKLTLNCFRALKPYERRAIDEQLAFFVDILKRGGIVQLAPEGVVSQDGNFSRLRGGLHAMLNSASIPMRVLPIGITYDLMTVGRVRVFVNVGPEITDLQGLSRRETDAKTAEAILARTTVTASQLASRFLLLRSRESAFAFARLVDYVGAEAEQCVKAGAFVDPRLQNDRARQKRVHQYLEYCLGAGILAADGKSQYRLENGNGRSGAPDPDRIISYVNNELKALTHPGPCKTKRVEA